MDLKRRDTPENREFWDFVEKTAREVRETMPAWAKGASGEQGETVEGEAVKDSGLPMIILDKPPEPWQASIESPGEPANSAVALADPRVARLRGVSDPSRLIDIQRRVRAVDEASLEEMAVPLAELVMCAREDIPWLLTELTAALKLETERK